MTRRKWTTNEQEEWLQEQTKDFLAADAANNTRQAFYADILSKWLEKWPLPDLSPSEIQNAGREDEAKKEKLKWQDNVSIPSYEIACAHLLVCTQRLKAWFRNRKRPTVSGKVAVIKSQPGVLKYHKRRPLQPWQVYHSLTYESTWKKVIDEEWGEYTRTWLKEHPGEPLIKTRFEFMNTFIKEKYEGETQEMKEKVDDHRRKLLETSGNVNQDYQR